MEADGTCAEEVIPSSTCCCGNKAWCDPFTPNAPLLLLGPTEPTVNVPGG